MSIVTFSLEDARAAAHSAQMAEIRGLASGIGFESSNREGEHLITYIYRRGDKFHISKPAPADLDSGYLIDPDGGFWSGKGTTLDADDIEELVGMALTIYGGWRHAEMGYRVIFQMWAEDYEVPVYVRLVNDRYLWHSIIWEHTATDCRQIGPKGEEPCEIHEDRLGL